MSSSLKFVTGTLSKYQKSQPGFEYQVFVSDKDSSYSEKFAAKYVPELQKKKLFHEPKLIYMAFRPAADKSHWTAAVLMLKKRKPRLFILDSIDNFSPKALSLISNTMAKYGGHTYLCCSALQSDGHSCAKFTLDFLIEMAKLRDIFSYFIKLICQIWIFFLY